MNLAAIKYLCFEITISGQCVNCLERKNSIGLGESSTTEDLPTVGDNQNSIPHEGGMLRWSIKDIHEQILVLIVNKARYGRSTTGRGSGCLGSEPEI